MTNNEYNYNVDVIEDGSTIDGQNSFFTYVVDPNPINNVSVNSEDLFIFVRLRAFPRNRSVITSENTYNTNSEENNSVSFIASMQQNGKGYATTNYTNIGGNEGSIEGLGIKSVEIKTAMFTPPIVNITFVDVRGGAVFNNHENQDDDGNVFNNSKYNAFFRLPYPIFELTVKGFYGKAVTYHLNLSKFEASVDTSSGDFIINCSFIGYQFAFLSDIITNYVIALNQSKSGVNALKNYTKKDNSLGLYSIPQLLQKYSEIAKFTDEFKKTDVDYELLKVYNTLDEKIQNIINIIGNSTLNNNSNIIGNKISTLKNDNYFFIRDVGIFSQNIDAEILNLENSINVLINDYNNIIDKYKLSNKINNFIFNKSKLYKTIDDTILNDVKKIILEFEGNTFDFIETNLIESKLNNLTPLYYIPFYSFRKELTEKKEKIFELKKKFQDSVVTSLNKNFVEKIGFNPTVFNVFEVIFGNVDIFLENIYNTCQKADTLSLYRVGDMKNYFAEVGLSDIFKSDNRIYPFPAVYNINGDYEWLGNIVGENNPNYPELELVSNIIYGLAGENNYEFNNTIPLSKSESYRWVPISPADVNLNSLENSNNINLNDQLYAAILNRCKILYEKTLIQNGNFFKFAELEGAYFSENILNEEYILYLLNTNTADLSLNGVQYFENNTITPILNNNNFDEYLFFSNENSNFFNLELSKNIQNIEKNKFKIADNISLSYNKNYKINDFFIPFLDLTACYNDNWTNSIIESEYVKMFNDTSNVLKIEVIRNLKFLDGDTTGAFFNDRNRINYYDYNAHNKISKSFTNYNFKQSIFDQFYYSQNNIYAKSLLFLHTLGFKSESYLIDQLTSKASTFKVNEYYLAYIGGLFYFMSELKNNRNILTDDIKNDISFNLIEEEPFFNLNINLNYDQYFIDFFIKIFLDFVSNTYKPNQNDGIEIAALTYVGLSEVFRNSEQQSNYEKSWDILFEDIIRYKTLINIDPSKILNSNQKKLTTGIVNQYFTLFFNSVKNFVSVKQNNKIVNNDPKNIANDVNLKIRIYNDLKNIYDKWLSYSTIDGKIYNFAEYVKGNITTKKLIDHCYFIDRTWSDIGDVAVLNPKSLINLSNETNGNIYSLMSRTLKDNNFNVYNIPTYVNYYNKDDVTKMFKPYNTIENSEGGACFVFQYIAGNSKILDLNNRVSYANDSFDFKSKNFVNIPNNFKNRKSSKNINDLNEKDKKDYLSKYNLSIFRVAYGDPNQNIFNEINVHQEEHRETQESILIQNQLSGGKGGAKRLFMGMDLYNMYAVRSYKTTVTCMGNMQIQPTQYFQLDNMPLFHGAHMITEVSHIISPNSVVTKFGGRRISKFAYPVVDKMTTYLNLEINETINSELLTNPTDAGELINGNDTYQSNPTVLTARGFSNSLIQEQSQSLSSPAIIDANNKILFTVTKNNNVSKFQLDSNFNESIINDRLKNIFKLNPSEINTYNIAGALCAYWVRNVFEDLGVIKIGNAPTDAWNWFMGLPQDNKMFYFPNNSKLADWSYQDYIDIGVKNGSLLFGYYNGSSYKKIAYNSMVEFTNDSANKRKDYLKTNKRISGDFDFTPVTHIGIFYNNMFYELTNGKVSLTPHKSFIPVASYYFLETLINLSKT